MNWRRVVLSAAALLGGVMLGAAAAPRKAAGFCEMDLCLNPNACVAQTIIRTGCDMQGVFCSQYQCDEQ